MARAGESQGLDSRHVLGGVVGRHRGGQRPPGVVASVSAGGGFVSSSCDL